MINNSHKPNETSENANIVSKEIITQHILYRNINGDDDLYDSDEHNRFRHWKEDRKSSKLKSNQQGSILMVRIIPIIMKKMQIIIIKVNGIMVLMFLIHLDQHMEELNFNYIIK